MVFIYITSRLLQVMDASREKKMKAAGFAGMCCTVPVGLGPFSSFSPRVCQAAPAQP